jgi:antitoxin YefM
MIMKTANYSELKKELKGYLDSVVEDSEDLVIHRPGNKSVVIVSLDAYNTTRETMHLMSSRAMMRKIQEGEEEIERGEGIAQEEGESLSDFLERVACTR